jgi:23S rRNA (adenine2503-C2)-methyltransferase
MIGGKSFLFYFFCLFHFFLAFNHHHHHHHHQNLFRNMFSRSKMSFLTTGRKISLIPLRTFVNYYSASEEELATIFEQWNAPSYRIKQVNEWIYEKGISNFTDMKNLPIELRTNLNSFFTIGSLKNVSEKHSRDGTIKRAYELNDGQLIESVLMPYKDGRYTACISSQAGCGMGCVFCATGQMGFGRQLTSNEIFEQVQQFSLELKQKQQRLSNVVLMGMGEPLANYQNVLIAIKRIMKDVGIGSRHITVSTVGIAPRIKKLADEGLQVGLAVSLHQANNEKRSSLMPVNKHYPIEELLEACQYYIDKTNRRISFEWASINGETDTEDTAHELGHLLKGMLCHVNIIPLNPTKGFRGKPASKERIERFIQILELYKVPATVRMRRGKLFFSFLSAFN